MTPRWGRGGTLPPEPTVVATAAVERLRPRMWPLVPERMLSVTRMARQAARQHPDQQGIVVAFTGAPVDRLDVVVAGAPPVELSGGRDRPVFVPLEPGTWNVSAGVTGETGYKHFTRYDVELADARHRQIELLWFQVERFQLSCDIVTIRPGTRHPAAVAAASDV